jgi:MFS family permease
LGFVPERRGRIVAVMGFLDNALSLITLLSLFLLGPALGRALVTYFDSWHNWSLPIQHLVVGICTMIAVTGMVLVYGAVWKLNPKSVAWYTWIQEVPVAGSVNLTGPVDVRQPPKR